MKLIRLSIVCCLLAGLFFASCKKDDDSTTTSIYAGPSQTYSLLLSADSLTLTGTVTGGGTLDMKYLWKEISGPDTGIVIPKDYFSIVYIDKSNFIDTGKYVFEFSATNSWGSTATGRTTVDVVP